MRAIALCLLALCLSACGDDTKYEQGYADALANKDAFQNEMEHVRTAVVLCQSKMNFYPKFYLNCDALATPELVKKSKGFGVSKSYWFLAVQLPICLIALFSLAVLALFGHLIIKISKLSLEKQKIQAYVSKKQALYFETTLQKLREQHVKELAKASNDAFEQFKREKYIQLPEEHIVLKIDDLTPEKAKSVLPAFDS
jgi:hypothetical protein